MPISNVSRVKTIATKLDINSDIIQTIYSNANIPIGNELVPNYKVIGFNSFIKNLKVFASVTSLEEAPLPEFALDDSATAKLTKTLDVEWKSPRKQLNLYIASVPNPDINQWLQVGSVSLLNPYGYPFRVYNVMDLFTDNLALELGENGVIGMQIQDVGYGLLSNEDVITVHGSYIEEIFLESPDVPININVTGTVGNQTPNYVLDNSSAINNSFLITN